MPNLALARSDCETIRPRAGAARPQYNSVQDVPTELRSAFESFGRQLQADIRAADSNAVRRVFDWEAISDGILDGTQGTERQLSQVNVGGGAKGRLRLQGQDERPLWNAFKKAPESARWR